MSEALPVDCRACVGSELLHRPCESARQLGLRPSELCVPWVCCLPVLPENVGWLLASINT